jgi:hypothetical protein
MNDPGMLPGMIGPGGKANDVPDVGGSGDVVPTEGTPAGTSSQPYPTPLSGSVAPTPPITTLPLGNDTGTAGGTGQQSDLGNNDSAPPMWAELGAGF